MNNIPLINLIKQNRNTSIDITRVRILLETGEGSVNERDRQGGTPLHWAAETKNSNGIMRILLEYRADINARNVRGDTPLAGAVLWNNVMAIEFLIQNGANVNNINNQGENLLFLTANNNILRILIDRGLDINSRDSRGRTPLHSSIEEVPSFQKFIFLIENGADPNVRDSEGKTPLNYAQENVSVLNTTLRENLTQDDRRDFQEQLENNRRIIIILITKMNNNNNSQFWTGYDPEDSCSICLESFSDGRGICVNKYCEHGFHCDCISRALLLDNRCPMCRADFELLRLNEMQQRAIQNSFGKKKNNINQLNAFKKYLKRI